MAKIIHNNYIFRFNWEQYYFNLEKRRIKICKTIFFIDRISINLTKLQKFNLV